MASRKRIEDFGRIAEMLKQSKNEHMFDNYRGRLKDFPEWFFEKSREEQEELLYKMIYNITDLENVLCECYQIARWGDDVEEG